MKYLFLVFVFLYACASIQPLDGGEIDKTPPQVLNVFPDSASTNINQNTFTFQFDEFIKTKNVSDLLLISPTQNIPPKLSVKGKKLTLKLNDSILPNTTYSFQFNGCIVDYNEGNELSNYKYIFSTGNYIDSLIYKGRIIDVQTNKPCENCNIQLYTSETDSIILNKKPQFLSTTNSNGIFKIENLPPNTFLAYAIKDENKNLTLDEDENVSFPITINSSNNQSDTFVIFPFRNKKPTVITKLASSSSGILKLTSNNPLLKTPHLETNSLILKTTFNNTKDTFTYYFKPTTDTTLFTTTIDSSLFKFSITANSKDTALKYIVGRQTDGVIIHIQSLINKTDTSLIEILQDSIHLPISTNQLNFNTLKIQTSSNHEQPLKLITKQGFITDHINRTAIKDTLLIRPLETGLPSLKLKVNIIDSVPHILQLLQSGSIQQIHILDSSQTVHYQNITPGKYTIKLISDTNKNGNWDSGNPFLNRLPEKVSLTEQFEMRLNWDKELTISGL